MMDWKKVIELVVEGLLTDGEHHKQWYLEQILIEAGEDLDDWHEELKLDGVDWEAGVAP